MHLEDLKRWQWCVIGLMTGLLVSWILVSLPPGALPRNIGAGDFEAALAQMSTDGQNPLKNLTVHPRVGDTQALTGERLSTIGGNSTDYVPFSLVIHLPYSSVDLGMTYPTLQARLADAARQNPAIHYHYAWWWTPAGTFVLWTEAGLLLIGGIWPSVIRFLVGAGYGRKREDPQYDLNRFGADEPNAATNKPVSTANDGHWSSGDGVAADAAESLLSAHAMETPVKSLNAGPLESTLPANEETDKHYAGVFYPTIVHRPDELKSDQQQ